MENNYSLGAPSNSSTFLMEQYKRETYTGITDWESFMLEDFEKVYQNVKEEIDCKNTDWTQQHNDSTGKKGIYITGRTKKQQRRTTLDTGAKNKDWSEFTRKEKNKRENVRTQLGKPSASP